MNYTAIANKAYKKIKQYGSACKINRVTEEVYDPATNTYTGGDLTINGYGLANAYSAEAVDGTNIKIGDVNMMCVLDSSPVVNDKIEFGSKEYSVISIKEINPNGKKVLYYEVQCR